MKISRKRLLVGGGILFLALLIAGVIVQKRTHLWFYQNQNASCHNCGRQVAAALDQYVLEKGSYPHGNGRPLTILATALDPYMPGQIGRNITSHEWAPECDRVWKAKREIPEEFCCYRYNMPPSGVGFPEMIVMYYYKPTRWECYMHRMDEIGRPVLVGGQWDFIPEDVFQEKQRTTLAYIEAEQRKLEKGTSVSPLEMKN